MNRRLQISIGRFVYWTLLPLRRSYRSKKTRAYGVIEHEQKVLIVKNWLGSGTWSLPGGGAQKGESHKETLARELHEETGIIIDKETVSVIEEGVHNREFGKKKFIIFHVPQQSKPAIFINHLEIVDSRWVAIKDLSTVIPASYELQRAAKFFN